MSHCSDGSANDAGNPATTSHALNPAVAIAFDFTTVPLATVTPALETCFREDFKGIRGAFAEFVPRQLVRAPLRELRNTLLSCYFVARIHDLFVF